MKLEIPRLNSPFDHEKILFSYNIVVSKVTNINFLMTITKIGYKSFFKIYRSNGTFVVYAEESIFSCFESNKKNSNSKKMNSKKYYILSFLNLPLYNCFEILKIIGINTCFLLDFLTYPLFKSGV